MANVGSLIAALQLDRSGFDSDLGSVKSGIGSVLGTAGKMGAAVVGAGIAGAGALFGLAKNAGDTADRLLDLKEITGMSTSEIQKWERVTTIAGVSASAVTDASFKLTKGLDGLAKEGSKSNDALKSLGMSFDDIANLNADERMDLLIKSLSGVEDSTERAKIGTDLFGGSWKDLAPIVSIGAEALDAAKDSANVFEDDDLNKMNDFRVLVDTLKETFGFLMTNIGLEVIPIFQEFFGLVTDNMPAIQSVIGFVFEFIRDYVMVLVDVFNTYLMPVFEQVYNWVVENMPSIQAGFGETFSTIGEIVSKFVELVMLFWGAFGDDIINTAMILFDVVKGLFSAGLNIINGLLDIFIGLFTGDWDRFGEGIKSLWSGIWEAIKVVLGGVWNLLYGPLISIQANIKGWFDGIVKSAKEWGSNMIKGFADGIIASGKKVVDAAKGVMDNVKRFLGFNSPAEEGEGRFIEDWGSNMVDGFTDGMKSNISKIDSTLKSSFGDLDFSGKLSSKMPESDRQLINLNIDNFIGDRYSLLKLERMLQEVRNSESGRIGGVVNV